MYSRYQQSLSVGSIICEQPKVQVLICDPLSENLALPVITELKLEAILSVQVIF